MAGWFPVGAPSSDFTPSQRSVINIGFVSTAPDYKFINHILSAEQWGPIGSNWYNGTAVFTQAVGSNGFPSSSLASSNSNAFGAGIRLPASSVYGDGTNEYYVLRWTGTGEVGFGFSYGSFTLQAGLSSGHGVVSSSRWTGTNPYIVLRYSGPGQLFPMYIFASDGTMANLELYRLSDETDRNAGLVYRMAYKNMIKSLCPSVLRFMDWHGGNVSRATRWEYRTLPSNPAFGGGGGGYDWVASPKYGRTSGTNQYTLSSVTGTPVAMTHGEIATFQIANGMVRSGSVSVSNITNASNGRVTTSSPHGYNTNDIIVHTLNARKKTGNITSGSNVITNTNNTDLYNGAEIYNEYFPAGTTVTSSTATTVTVNNNALATTGIEYEIQPMPKLHYQPCQITVVDSTNYDLNINTSTYGAFTGSTANSNQYITLNIGGRGEYPVIFENGSVPASNYGNGFLSANDYKTAIFDKTVCASRDTSGNWVFGAWLFNNYGSNNGHAGGVPPELCVALINEINALSPVRPIHMYFNLPHLGLASTDPDYSAASNYALKALDVIFNGSTIAGKTWAPLTASANLYLEYSNETWNFGGDQFSQTFYLMRRGFHRWNNALGDVASMASFRSSLVFDDVRQAYSTQRIKCILGCWGTKAADPGDVNSFRMDGTYSYAHDALVTGNVRLNGIAPMTYPHDAVAFASYIDANIGSSWDANNLATLTSSWVSNIGNASAQEANCASYNVGNIDSGAATPNTGGETIGKYLNKLTAYCNKVATFGAGKRVLQYEGGWDHEITVITSGSLGGPSQYYTVATFASGNTTISNIDSGFVTALSVGDFIIGPGIPADCRVATKPTSTSITVTIAPTVTTSFGEFFAMTPANAFLRAVKRSQSWSTAYRAWMDAFAAKANAAMPSDYVIIDKRWGHIYPDAYGTSTTEWGSMDLLFTGTGTRNRGLPN